MRASIALVLLGALVGFSARAEAPPSAAAPPRPADYWLVLDWSQDVIRARPRTLRTVPVPVVRTLGIDISRLRPPLPARLSLNLVGGGRARIALEPGVDRYVLDIETGFSGFEPYQWGFMVIRRAMPGDRRLWQTTLRAVPGYTAGDP